MKRLLVTIALALALSSGVLAAACGGNSEPKNLTAIYDTITFFPGSTIDGGPVGPAGLSKGNIETFKSDRRMFIASATVTKDQVLDYYSKEIPKLGWKKEDPAKPKARDMQNYCSAGFVTCLSFLKDNVRMIVSAPIQLQLNPLSTQGVSYHFHLEGR
jgi:hypothetical protein